MKKTSILMELMIVALVVGVCFLGWEYSRLNTENKQQINEINKQARLITSLVNNNSKLNNRVRELEKKMGVIKATITAYSPCYNETDSTPTITAFMKKVKPGGIAVSRDLLKMGWTPGKQVYIEGYGVFTINDVMNKRWKKRFDIFYPTKQHALNFGVKKNTPVILIQDTT